MEFIRSRKSAPPLSTRKDHNLALLFLETVFEEHEDWPLLAVDVLVFAHGDHGLGIHGLT